MGHFDRKKAWSDFRVGLVGFIALCLLVLGIIFAGGDKGLLFRETTVFKVRLADVGGLKKGSPVTMGGMTIGKVTDMGFVDDPEQTRMEVSLLIRRDVRKFIKVDSVPSVKTQGMMGDRYVEISRGGPESGVLPDGGVLTGAAAVDFDGALHKASAVLDETHQALKSVNEQRGTVGKLFNDEKLYAKIVEITDQVNELIKDFKKNPRKYIKFSLF